MLELYVYREQEREKIGDACKNRRRDLSVVKKKGKKNNNMIRGDLWDQARGDTIPQKKKSALDGTEVIGKS